MTRFYRALLSVLGLVLVTHPLLATTTSTPTFVVGTCRPNGQSFTSIGAAVSGVPAGSIILVCPGTYHEQVHIIQPLTLQGISSGNSDQAIIMPPTTGLATNAANDVGNPLAVQVWVDNVPGGPVNIRDLIVDGSGNGVTTCSPSVVGIFYQNSSGTIDRITARNQLGNQCSLGIQAEGGSASPTVTIQNNDIHNVNGGISTETFAFTGTPELTATIKGNYIDLSGADPGAGTQGIVINEGATTTVSANVVVSTADGITAQGMSQGSVSGNTVVNSFFGIEPFSDTVSFTANKIFNSAGAGINIQGTKLAKVQSNTVTASSIGIEFTCFADPNVTHNTIIDAATGIDQVPGTVAAPNTYFNVATIRMGC